MSVPGHNLTAQSSGSTQRSGSEMTKIPWGEASRIAKRQARDLLDGRDRPLAEDIAQTSLLKLYENRARIRVGWMWNWMFDSARVPGPLLISATRVCRGKRSL
jgi:hypothetical protein